MRKNIIIFLLFLFIIPSPVWASAASAYQEYLQEFDVYRSNLNDFKVARAEYLKFKTLTSQQTALEKTKIMLAQRSQLLRSYLQFINERLNESTSMSPSTKSVYQALIKNEVTFLNNHTALMSDIGSIQDADSVSKKLSSHYTILQSNVYQTIAALKIAELNAVDAIYTDLFTKSYSLFQANRSSYTTEKQSILDRWLLQIQNKQDLFKQKTDEITSANAALKSSSTTDITTNYQKIQKLMSEAKQYLSEGTSFLQELTTSMQYGT